MKCLFVFRPPIVLISKNVAQTSHLGNSMDTGRGRVQSSVSLHQGHHSEVAVVWMNLHWLTDVLQHRHSRSVTFLVSQVSLRRPKAKHRDIGMEASSDPPRGPIHTRNPHGCFTALCDNTTAQSQDFRETSSFKFFPFIQLTEVSTGPVEGSKGKGSTKLTGSE